MSYSQARPVSYANTTLPAMLYGNSDRPRLSRTSSEGALNVLSTVSSNRSNLSPVASAGASGQSTDAHEGCVSACGSSGSLDTPGSMLQYWKLEKELREAKDMLKQKDEEVCCGVMLIGKDHARRDLD